MVATRHTDHTACVLFMRRHCPLHALARRCTLALARLLSYLHSGPLNFPSTSRLCWGSTLFRTPRRAVAAAAVAPIAGRSTHNGMPLTTDLNTFSRGAPRCNSSKGRTTTASPACRTPLVRLVQACWRPSAASLGCRKSAAPRSTAVHGSASAAMADEAARSPPLPAADGSPLPGRRNSADEAPAEAAAAREPEDDAAWSSSMQAVMYSKEDWAPTKMRSVRSMLSTVTFLKKETNPRSIVLETRCESLPVRYILRGSITISTKPPPMFAKDLMGVTPVSDLRICVRFMSELHLVTT
mmetsp:Transcript_35977/g.92956  ORF Transcript_35977/g.92956 Transcript_35977/m.92956 type:complete len:297 (-) Transcript_35977:576-1466(-)